MSQSNQEYIFKVKTKEAFVIKLLGELLCNTTSFAPFRINDQGIILTQTDEKEEQLIDIRLEKENFQYYKCNKNLNFNVNSKNLHILLKAIKKKDCVTLYITEAEPLKLGICVEQADENNKSVNTICINYSRPEEYSLPTGYDNPVIMSSKEFQKMKTLTAISKVLKVTSKPGYIKFFCDGGALYSRELILGDETEVEHVEPYIQHFSTHHITGLTKCAAAGVDGNINIYIHSSLPMKIKMRAGKLGYLTVYIKSHEMIDEEYDEKQKEENGEEEEEEEEEETK